MIIDNRADAVRIFRDSLIRVDCTPVYVENVDDGLQMRCQSLRDFTEMEVSVNSNRINRTPVPTGFVNGYKTSVFVSRSTKRSFSQGLTSENIRAREIHASPESAMLSNEVCRIRSRYLCNMIDGLYPDFESALDLVNEGHQMCAFSRIQAVDKYFNIYYKTTRVGSVNPDNGHLIIDQQFTSYKWVFEQKCE